MSDELSGRISTMIFNKFLYRLNKLGVFFEFIKHYFQVFHQGFFSFHVLVFMIRVNGVRGLFKTFAGTKQNLYIIPQE